MNFRNIIKRVYCRLNPQYKYILDMNNRIAEIERRLDDQQSQRFDYIASTESALDRLFSASEPRMYRYLYLRRYIRPGDRVLDIEAGYGTGAELLYRYTDVDSCDCLNSLDYYTRIGGMYHASEMISFQTATFHEVNKKYNLVCFFDEKKTGDLTQDEKDTLYHLCEYNGILALAINISDKDAETIISEFIDRGFTLEKQLYQKIAVPEMTEVKADASDTLVLYLKKNG